jgi:hypothetical protein
MALEVLQHLTWDGVPKEMGDLFVLRKNRRETRATIFSHVFGWEVRLLVGKHRELVRSQVCRSQEEVLSTGEHWRSDLAVQGWK